MSGRFLRAPGGILVPSDGESTPAVSHENGFFFVRLSRLAQGIRPIHGERFLQGRAQVLDQFPARASLAVDTGHFLNPANPPSFVFFYYGGKASLHTRKANAKRRRWIAAKKHKTRKMKKLEILQFA